MLKRYTNWLIVILFSIAIFFATDISRHKPEDNSLSVNFLDVGQGDAALIQKGDFQILIDGGPDEKVLSEISKIMSPLDRKIELIILSHPHADHLVGINDLLDRYEVGEILGTGVVSPSAEYVKFLAKVKEKNIPFNVPNVGSQRSFVENSEIDFLWPGDKFTSKTLENVNNSSLVAKVCYFEKCTLFLGDVEQEEQQIMLDYYKNLKKESIFASDIVKVAHHGSSNGLLPDLQAIINAKYAVISAGKDNQFGHPHQIVLDYFNGKGVTILRTDQKGTIRFKLEQNNIEIK